MLAWSCDPAGVFVSVLSSIQALGLAIFASIFAPDVPISYVVTLFGGLNDPMQVRCRCADARVLVCSESHSFESGMLEIQYRGFVV
jgi:hypothetical protein